MKILHLVATELRRLTATGMARLALVALMLVPVLYAGLYLWANNDPYGSLKDVPVALVVEDTGSTLDGKAVNYGEEVRDQLLDDASVGWHVTTAEEAAAGVRDGEFDFILTLGPDFSSALTSASGDSPTQAVVQLTTNDTNSFLATTIAGQVAEKVRASITERVGKEAALTLLNGFATVRSNLVEAVDGATTLADGTTTAAEGAATLAAGIATASDGAYSLAQGSGSANVGAQQLDAGLQQLRAGSADLPSQTAQLNAGAQQVAAGNAQLATTADQVAVAVQDAVNQVPAARAEIVAILDASSLTPEQKAAVLARLDEVGTAIDDGNAKVQEADAQIGALATGSAQLAAGTQQLADSAPALTNGIASAAAGSSQLSGGLQQVAQGALDLSTGMQQLRQGSADLSSGLNSIDSGAGTLRDGLAAGLDDVPNQTAEQREASAQTISDPVALDTSAVTKASNYGAGMAPFFISLAAWIGIYALFLIVKPLSRRAVTALKRPFTVTTAGWATPAVLGAIQMVVVFGIITLALGYQVEHPWGMLGFMALTSATFATIILALNILLGSVGQFLGLVLMVLQLVTAGGTFPWQTLPGPLQVLHQVLPMSHAVDGIRQLMYGGNLEMAGADAGALFFWLVGALLVSYLGARRLTRHRTLRDLRPSLIG
ncbi:YhgE/Pip domain-containing protein [Herbiconiux moechotypicola]|uniref:YhgE/Pip domain-containing protein n=1 Tax=Herbiconiux moechotypicola TaxID=637393 RepID=A0ABN3D944_9MICO|nr:YhgE/Pip domain-containing protein [Herbiconiux moechotypicola]MCS5729112.1 YhgE/Pip domain-containing protein [Herbiconiux moechotypicola]